MYQIVIHAMKKIKQGNVLEELIGHALNGRRDTATNDLRQREQQEQKL